jgi:hypothetical protein
VDFLVAAKKKKKKICKQQAVIFNEKVAISDGQVQIKFNCFGVGQFLAFFFFERLQGIKIVSRIC